MFLYVHVVSNVVKEEVIVKVKLYRSMRKKVEPHRIDTVENLIQFQCYCTVLANQRHQLLALNNKEFKSAAVLC